MSKQDQAVALKEAIDKYMAELPSHAAYDILGMVARNLSYHGVDTPGMNEMAAEVDKLRKTWR